MHNLLLAFNFSSVHLQVNEIKLIFKWTDIYASNSRLVAQTTAIGGHRSSRSTWNHMNSFSVSVNLHAVSLRHNMREFI